MDTDDSLSSSSASSHASSGKRGGKRPVSRRKKVNRTKQRGCYKPKKLGATDIDLATCIISDDEVRADFMESNVPGGHGDDASEYFSEDTSACTDTDSGSATTPCTTPTPTESLESPPQSSCATPTPPESSESRPQSSCSLDQEKDSSTSSLGLVRGAIADIIDKLGAVNSSAAEPTSPATDSPSINFIEVALNKFKNILPKQWIPVANGIGFHLLYIPIVTPKTVQREIVMFYDGRVSIFIHSETVISNQVLTQKEVPSLLTEKESSLEEFCAKGLELVNLVMEYYVCIGANDEKRRYLWTSIRNTYVDYNPYREESYTETCRSVNCEWLVRKKKHRCSVCGIVFDCLRKRAKSIAQQEPNPKTRNDLLTLPQALHKLQDQAHKIKQKDKRIHYLEQKVKTLIEKEGVDIDDQLNTDFNKILEGANLSELQKAFLKEQLDASKKKDSRSHRWHPSMIRFALHVRMQAGKSGYDAIRDAGVLRLPSQRTLFDYSHSILPQIGVSEGIVKIVEKRVAKLPEEFKKYHSLLCDEMYISKNLVYRQSDGQLIGYAHLDEVDEEIRKFEVYVEHMFSGKEEKTELQLAKTMLAFMVKGLASDVKYVVAAYPTNNLSADSLYVRSWEVISRLERAGIKILAYVCDHAPTNRTFYDFHAPITITKPRVVFDTVNFCSPEGRPLYLISDVCHILKTIRNSFYNSGEGEKKTRCMELNGQKIVWKTIVRVYLKYKDDTFRKSFKLNAQNVFPDSYSCMSVKNAAVIMSDTVADLIEEQKWPDTEETVRFIRYTNKFFDCLNGAYSGHHIRTRNQNLAPYSDVNDSRFAWLGVPLPGHENNFEDEKLKLPFLEYLTQWTEQIDCMKVGGKPIAGKEKEQRKLSWQTVLGIQRSIRGIAGAIRYLLSLSQPPSFICARVFSQDPLEQHFSLQRQAGGGSNNPNASQFGSRQVSLALQRDMGVKCRKSNVESSSLQMEWVEEPLAKRPRASKKQ